MVKDPTAATTTINDDSDVTTVRACQRMRQSPKANITYTATFDGSCGWRGDATLRSVQRITIADGALQEPRRFQQVMMYT
ncbi:hypothetical protein OK016_00130 [Vibrio chagasii]|nr:hypothetical protein [Vibrio chagasii]